jgi:DNA-binding LacI/PurR family transcriptional regulator
MSISKVAQAAGVSISTVARVINNRPGISTKTVASVREAIKRVGYVAPPPALRRGPKTDAVKGIRTRRVAILLIGMDPLVTQRVSAPGPVAKHLADSGLQLVYCPMADPAVLPPDISPKQVDGVIMQGLQPVGAADRALRSLPCVWKMTRRSTDFWADYVEPDNRMVGRLAFDYLSQKGVRQMAFFNLQPNYPAFKARGESFIDVCQHAGVKYQDLSGDAVDHSDRLHDMPIKEGIEQQVQRLMPMLGDGPVGMFTSGHNYLPGIYRSLMSKSVRIGKDVILIAGDYDSLMRSALIPMPACLDVQIPVIGERVVEQLLWRMANREAPGPVGIVVPPRIVLPDFDDAVLES